MKKGIGLVFLAFLSAGCSSMYDDFLDPGGKFAAEQRRWDIQFQRQIAADQRRFEAQQAENAAKQAEWNARLKAWLAGGEDKELDAMLALGILFPSPQVIQVPPTSSYPSYDDSQLRSELEQLNYELRQMRYQQELRDIRNMYNY